MGVFEYKAFNPQGKVIRGIVDAGTLEEAREKLRKENFFPIQVLPTQETVERERVIFWRGIPLQEVAIFTRQLSSLLHSGLPLVEAMEALIKQYERHPLKRVLMDICEKLKEGKTLSQSLSFHPRIFSPIYVSMVKTGEESGELHNILQRISVLLFRNLTIRNRIKNAFTYPVFVAVVGAGVLFLLLNYVIPSLSKLFSQFHYSLPFLTQSLINFSQFIRTKGRWILLVLLLVCLFLFFMGRQKKVKGWIGEVKLKIPLIGRLIRKSLLVNFTFTLSALLKGGVPLLTALALSRPLLQNQELEEIIKEAEERINRGESFSSTLKRSSFFPPLFTQMVEVGERTGNLEEMLEEVSQAMEEDLEISLSQFTILLEPAVILVIGVVVGIIVISVLLPIFEMNRLLLGK